MKRLFESLAVIAVIVCCLSCEKVDTLENRINNYEGILAKLNTNDCDGKILPTGIVMLSSTMEECHKKDTLDMYVRVNPSDYVLKTENLDFWVSHDLYTCYTEGEKPEDGYPAKFDESAKCEFKVLGAVQEQIADGEGVWKIRFAIGGKGNFYDIANVYVIAKAKDSQGEEKSVCSATPCKVVVTPTLNEGIHVNTTAQNLYARNKTGMMEEGVAKPYYVGLWSNSYVNNKGKTVIYDRTNVKVESVPDTLYSTLDNSYFEKYGFAAVTPNLDSQYWKDQLDKASQQTSVTVPGAVFTLKKTAGRTEAAEFPFLYKVFYLSQVIKDVTYSIAGDDLEHKSFTYDYTEERAKTGWNEKVKLWYDRTSIGNVILKCGVTPTNTKEKLSFVIDFPFAVTPGVKSAWAYTETTMLACGQATDGSDAFLPTEEPVVVRYYYFRHNHNIVE